MSAALARRTHRIVRVVGIVLGYVALWAGITLLLAGIGIRLMWGSISVDQMLLNVMTINADGGGGAVVWIGILGFGVLPILLTLGVFFLRRRRRRKLQRLGRDVVTRKLGWLPRTIATALVAAVVVGGGTAFVSTVKVGDYIKAANSDYDLGEFYRQPELTAPAKKKNLVLIYFESGEGTLSNTKLFEKDPFKPLEKSASLKDGWKSIDNLQQYEGGGWTMAGITSTQCGIPLKGTGSIRGQARMNKVDGVRTYLGSQPCLGNFLKGQGYDNVFMGGANGTFAGKDTFLKDHGYDTEYSLSDWRAKGEPENQFRSDWGLSDKRLMANAKTQVDKLHATAEKTGTPFNLSMLTLDTHEPVHVYNYCKVDTEEPLISVFQCSAQQVADFVDYMKKKGYLEDTAVVIMGDHFKHMGVTDKFHKELDDNPHRSIFNRIWVPDADRNELHTRSGIDQLNLLPTILESMGFGLQDRQAGLGVSAFSQKIPKGSAQGLKPQTYKDVLDSQSKDFYQRAWGTERTGR